MSDLLARDGVDARVQASPPDVVRLKWIDPSDTAKFDRSEPTRSDGTDVDTLLGTILDLTDRIFDNLSVLQNSGETTARGAMPRHHLAIDCEDEMAQVRAAESSLWAAYISLKAKQSAFMASQMEDWPAETRRRLHIGSAQFVLEGWTNVDAGGGDLALNVNWGLPFCESSVDLLFCAHMLEHLRFADQAPAFLQDVWRVLKPGGIARFVVPDISKLLAAYVNNDRQYFVDRQRFYPLDSSFLVNGVATLDYVLLYSGVGHSTLNYNHKFGYDAATLASLLCGAGFSQVRRCDFQSSPCPDLRIDDCSFDAQVVRADGEHFSLFMEAVK